MDKRKRESVLNSDNAMEKVSYSTKKESRTESRQPAPPKMKKYSKTSRTMFFDFGCAVAIYFLKQVELSNLYNRKLQDTYFNQLFENKVKIGEGSFGVVYKAQSKEDGKQYAIKLFKKASPNRFHKYKEVVNCEKVERSDYCVNFVLAWEEQECLYIQMEHCLTSLEKYSIDNTFSNEQLWNIFADVCLGLKHLHDRNLIHLDIKPANIMISERGVCKLADFGLLIDLMELKNSKKPKSKVINLSEGDAKYLAKEVLEKQIYTTACDMFSFGITLLELSTDLLLPLNGPLWHELRKGVFPNMFYKNVPEKLQRFIERMMLLNYLERPSVNVLLEDPLMKDMIEDRRNLKVNNFQNNMRNAETPTINIEPSTPPSTPNYDELSTPILNTSRYNLSNLERTLNPSRNLSLQKKRLFTF